jgi:hypothetical protein
MYFGGLERVFGRAPIIASLALGVVFAIVLPLGERILDRLFDLPFVKPHRTVLQYGFIVLTLLVQAAIFYLRGHPPEAKRLKDWGLQQLQHPGFVAFCIVPIVVTFGKLASLWKMHAQRSYGVSEVVFGTLLCFNVVYVAPKLDLSRFVSLGGAIYVVSRGFNNIADSENKLSVRGAAVPLWQSPKLK